MAVNKIYYSAMEIANMLGISKAKAYGIIRDLNAQLEADGFIVIQGKVSKTFFEEKWYGMSMTVQGM